MAFHTFKEIHSSSASNLNNLCNQLQISRTIIGRKAKEIIAAKLLGISTTGSGSASSTSSSLVTSLTVSNNGWDGTTSDLPDLDKSNVKAYLAKEFSKVSLLTCTKLVILGPVLLILD